MYSRAIELLMSEILTEEEEDALQDFINYPDSHDSELFKDFLSAIENDCNYGDKI
jgi:hypothetical protein